MKSADFILLALIALLTLFGLIMVYNASSFIAYRDFGDKYHYFKDQIAWVLLGFTAMAFFSRLDYHLFYKLAVPILVSAICLLIAVFLPGLSVHALGARRWINLGVTILQPAEYVKLALSIYLAAWFSNKEKGRVLPFVLLVGFVLLLIMLEPDMGTASIVLSQSLAVYFLSGGSLVSFALGIPLIGILGFILIKLEPYRAARLTAFLNAGSSLEGTSYHVRQILIAFGSGGLMGVGLGNSLQKYAYLPENTTDSIFAIIAEELGFFGATILIILLVAVVARGFLIATKSKDNFGKLLAAGITTFLGTQMLLNLASMTALLPLTGVPLPFISYGGSSLIIDLSAVGMLLNISRQKG